MKNFLLALFIIFLGGTLIISCTKTDLNNSALASQNLSSTKKVIPDAPYCGIGYQWDFYLRKCVPVCPSGYHNDSITGACVVNGSGGGGQQYISVITNPNNPDEFVGETHNAGMATLMPNYSNGDLEPTEQNVFSYTSTYVFSQGYDTVETDQTTNYVLQNFGPTYQETNITSLANMLYSKGSISIYVKNYLLQLASSISSFTSDSIDIPTQAYYNSFADNLITYENQISGNSSLTSTDKSILLSAFSVARYSVVFNVNYSIQLSSPSQSPSIVQPMLSQNPWFSWGRVVGGDVVGAISFGVAGGIASGGAAVVPSAITGGIGSSLYEAGMQLWNHFF